MKEEWCGEESKSELNLQCTLPKNHKGDHIATVGGYPCETWPNINQINPQQKESE